VGVPVPEPQRVGGGEALVEGLAVDEVQPVGVRKAVPELLGDPVTEALRRGESEAPGEALGAAPLGVGDAHAVAVPSPSPGEALPRGEALTERVSEGEGEALRVREGDAVGVRLVKGVGVAEGQPVTVQEPLGGGEALGVTLPQGVALLEAHGEAVGAPLPVGAPEALGAPRVAVGGSSEADSEGLAVAPPLPEGEPEALGQRVPLPLPLPRADAEALPL
jgi:hypothetical protein